MAATESTTDPDDTRADGDRRETLVPIRMFVGIGTVVSVMAAIYAASAYDDAGTVMLVLAAGLSFTCGIYLHLQFRTSSPAPGTAPSTAADHAAMYLPHASIWPFWIGVGAFLISNGLLLGTWFLVPGVVVLLFGLVGFIRQSRNRS